MSPMLPSIQRIRQLLDAKSDSLRVSQGSHFDPWSLSISWPGLEKWINEWSQNATPRSAGSTTTQTLHLSQRSQLISALLLHLHIQLVHKLTLGREPVRAHTRQCPWSQVQLASPNVQYQLWRGCSRSEYKRGDQIAPGFVATPPFRCPLSTMTRYLAVPTACFLYPETWSHFAVEKASRLGGKCSFSR